MYWYMKVLRNYVGFSGRARRKEYWMFVLVSVLISIGLMIVDSVTGTFNIGTGWGLLSGLYSLAVLIPSLAVSVRRLHDRGLSGWWLLLVLVPLIGAIALLVIFVMDGESGDNRFGPDPKMEDEGMPALA
ncbi:MAG: DUF805 domain-containing protein [Pseudomonadota bacterium]|nr:DUF805 domain-containing protein [Pseudomonadota bacterium]